MHETIIIASGRLLMVNGYFWFMVNGSRRHRQVLRTGPGFHLARKWRHAPNGHSIFLPAAGCFLSSDVNGAIGIQAVYWSSSLYSVDPMGAWTLIASSGYQNLNGHERCNGCPVRAVRAPQK